METLLKDVHYALRSLLRNRGFAIAAVLTLALGIGANTAIFSAVHGVLLRPLPYPDAERIAVVWITSEQEGTDRDISSFPIFSDLREQSRTLAALAGHTGMAATITEGDDPERVLGAQVTGDFFRVLGVGAALGRAIGPAETELGEHRVVVLSHGLWTRHFGADPAILGRTMPLGGTLTYEVIGVMPPGFAYPSTAELWTPLARTEGMANLIDSRGTYWLSMIGRLAPGVSPAQADAELNGLMSAMYEEYPGQMAPGTGIFVEPLLDTIVGDVRPALLLLLGAVGFVLLIACANVANLLLARGAGRQKELAVRTALGASGGRLARQALTESVVLAGIGAGVGLLLAMWGTAALVAASPADLPRVEAVRIDGLVVGFAALIALLTGVAFGLAPALQARGATIGAVLREGGRGASGDRLARLRPLLVTAQIALALVLLVGAGLLVRSFASLQAVEPGFATERVLSFRVTAGAARYPEEAHVREFHDAFHERLRAMPGVESVTSISGLFLDRLPNMAPITVAGRAQAETGEQAASVTYDRVDAGFFNVMSTPIVRGREFGPEDRAGGVSVVVVNETFVRRYFPGDDPIGQRFAWGAGGENAQWRTIVGVAADARRSGLAEPVRAEAYISRAQEQPRGMEYLVRATGDPVALVPGIRAALRDMDPTLPIAELRTIDQALREAVATQRFVMLLLGGFAVVAVLLAAIGVYGVLSYLVGQRTQEIGIRMAVGASRPQVLGMVLRQAMLHVLPGVAIGVAGALAVTRLIRAQLFGVSPTDPLTFVGVATLLVAVALLASWIPAWRAAQVEPIVTLKAE